MSPLLTLQAPMRLKPLLQAAATDDFRNELLATFTANLTDRLQQFAGPSFRCSPDITRETTSNVAPPLSRSGLAPILYLGADQIGRILISARAFSQIVGALAGHPPDLPMPPGLMHLTQVESLVLADFGELVARSFARALPKVLASFDPKGYAPHPEIRFGGFRRLHAVPPKKLVKFLAFDATLHGNGVTGGITLLTPPLEDIIEHEPMEKFSPLRDRWEWRQEQRAKQRAIHAANNLRGRLLVFDRDRLEALLHGESPAIAAACLALSPNALTMSYLKGLSMPKAVEIIDLMVAHRSPRLAMISALNRLLSCDDTARGRASSRDRLINALMALRLER